MDLVDKVYNIPYPSTGKDQLLARLEYINSIENIDVLIPNFNAELYSFMKSEDQLKAMGIHTFLPTIEQFEERQKSNLPEYGEKYQVDVPKSRAITSISELYTLKPDFEFPFLVKGKFYDAYVCYNKQPHSSTNYRRNGVCLSLFKNLFMAPKLM